MSVWSMVLVIAISWCALSLLVGTAFGRVAAHDPQPARLPGTGDDPPTAGTSALAA